MHTFEGVKQKHPATARRSRSSVVQRFSSCSEADRTAIRNIIRPTPVQAKHTVGAPNDRYEQEADAVADRVMRMPDTDVAQRVETGTIQPMPIQRICAGCEEGVGQRVTMEDEEEVLQAKEATGKPPHVNSRVESGINSIKGGGQPLDTTSRSFFEPRFGRDFSNVRVHTDGHANDLSSSISARAFTLGNDVVFGAGEYQPGSDDGKRLLGHELTHVVQQRCNGAAQVSSDSAVEVRRQATPGNSAGVTKTRKQILAMPLDKFHAYIYANPDWSSCNTDVCGQEDFILYWFLEKEVDNLGSEDVSAVAYKYKASDLISLSDEDYDSFVNYLSFFNPANTELVLSGKPSSITKAVAISKLVERLKSDVRMPVPVIREVFDTPRLEHLVDNPNLIDELKIYYEKFKPTIEISEEWPMVITLLNEGVNTNLSLQYWVSDLHILTPDTRSTLRDNVNDHSGTKPLLLILLSTEDHNGAFFANSDLEGVVTGSTNLALVVQGAETIEQISDRIDTIVDNYGQITPSGNRVINQLEFAGHGNPTGIEMATGREAHSADDNYVEYELRSELDIRNNRTDTERLIFILLTRMDQNSANIILDGCSTGGRHYPETMFEGSNYAVSPESTDIERIREYLSSEDNMRSFIEGHMLRLGINAELQAPVAPLVGGTRLDASGRLYINSQTDPAITLDIQSYIQYGTNPSAVMAAALEACADPAIGPETTAFWLRTRWETLPNEQRVGGVWNLLVLKLAIESALQMSGNVAVDPRRLLKIHRRAKVWTDLIFPIDAKPLELASSVDDNERAYIFAAISQHALSSSIWHLLICVEEAWLYADPSHSVLPFLSALKNSGYTYSDFKTYLNTVLVNKRIDELLTVNKAVFGGQLLLALSLALSLAIEDKSSMHRRTKQFLRHAAGGNLEALSFPPQLNVRGLISADQEAQILKDLVDPTNMFTTRNFEAEGVIITVEQRARVRTMPTLRMPETIFMHLSPGETVNIVGETGRWYVIEDSGQTGYVYKTLVDLISDDL